MSDNLPSSDPIFQKGQPIWYWSERGRLPAEFVTLSKSGKRALIRYGWNDLHRKWMNGSFVFVSLKNIEPVSS